MRVLGFDPGTATTGYGVVDAGASRLTAVAYGVIRVPPAAGGAAARLRLLHRRAAEVIAAHRPDCVAVEELFFSRNVRTALAVGQARGVLLLAAAEAGLPVVEYTPNEVKLAVTAYGGAGKRQVQLMVRALLGLAETPRPDDAADALAVAVCAQHRRNWEQRAGGRA